MGNKAAGKWCVCLKMKHQLQYPLLILTEPHHFCLTFPSVFPLQLLGFDVDVINSVQFSNHTGYPNGWEGEVLDGTMLTKLVDGMDRNMLISDESGCPRIGNILTGYIGSESFLRAVVSVVQKLKGVNSKCRYVCDPVLGDNGKFYVPRELVDIYRRDVLPLVSAAKRLGENVAYSTSQSNELT